jgi:DNA-binding NarL/FixJ family response regulator
VITGDFPMLTEALCVALGTRGVEAHQLGLGPTGRLLAASARYSAAAVVVLNPAEAFDASGQPRHGGNLVAGLVKQGKRVLLLATAGGHGTATAAAIAGGAAGLLDISMTLEALRAAVIAAAAGEEMLSAQDRQRWLAWLRYQQEHRRDVRKRQRRLARLTAREWEVLRLLAQGHRAAAIAEQLLVSLSTVRAQIRSILVKLEVSSQLEAVAALHSNDDIL